jgi:hypothetical protein
MPHPTMLPPLSRYFNSTPESLRLPLGPTEIAREMCGSEHAGRSGMDYSFEILARDFMQDLEEHASDDHRRRFE